jgi:hypothetical protein
MIAARDTVDVQDSRFKAYIHIQEKKRKQGDMENVGFISLLRDRY